MEKRCEPHELPKKFCDTFHTRCKHAITMDGYMYCEKYKYRLRIDKDPQIVRNPILRLMMCR
jgi:hypothetical protein